METLGLICSRILDPSQSLHAPTQAEAFSDTALLQVSLCQLTSDFTSDTAVLQVGLAGEIKIPDMLCVLRISSYQIASGTSKPCRKGQVFRHPLPAACQLPAIIPAIKQAVCFNSCPDVITVS